MPQLPSIEAAEQAAMLALARATLQHHWQRQEPAPTAVLPHGQLLLPCFVTLQKAGQLRGCIGCLEARMPLAQAIAYFSLAAAFSDPRFAPLSQDELPQIRIHLSLLGSMTPLPAHSRAALLAALTPGEDGLKLQDPQHQATFLPSVWEQLPNPEEFVDQLLRKGGWSQRWPGQLQAWRYPSLSFGED